MHQGTVIAAQTFTFELEGDCLMFAPPMPFPSQYVAGLVESGRMQPVKRPELTRRGAKQYCWLMPSEILRADGKEWRPSESVRVPRPQTLSSVAAMSLE